MKEIKIENDHVSKARKLGGVCIKGNIEGRAAFPDQLVLKADGFYWIEFKVPGNDRQDDQVEMHKVLTKKGHTVYTCDNQEDADVILLREFNLDEIL